MNTNWICRNYKNGDEIVILDLFEKVFEKKLSLGFWKWRYVDNPFGQGIIKLMFDRDKLIGHYAVIPALVSVDDNLVNAAFAMTVMTHPDYRRQGIFSYLANEVYKEAAIKGFKFVYGFPNRNTYQGYEKKLEWKIFPRITILRFITGGNRTEKIRSNFSVLETKSFDDSVDELWNNIKGNFQVIVPRTKKFLNWRFTQNPSVDYKIFFLLSQKQMAGYLVTKIFEINDKKIGHIVDILGINGQVIQELLINAFDYFLTADIREITCWMHDSSLYSKVMKDLGFKREIPGNETYFGLRNLDKNNYLRDIENIDKWYLTMADSDVF